MNDNTDLMKPSMLSGGKRDKEMGGLPCPESTCMSGRSSRGQGGTRGTERLCGDGGGGHRGGGGPRGGNCGGGSGGHHGSGCGGGGGHHGGCGHHGGGCAGGGQCSR